VLDLQLHQQDLSPAWKASHQPRPSHPLAAVTSHHWWPGWPCPIVTPRVQSAGFNPAGPGLPLISSCWAGASGWGHPTRCQSRTTGGVRCHLRVHSASGSACAVGAFAWAAATVWRTVATKGLGACTQAHGTHRLANVIFEDGAGLTSW